MKLFLLGSLASTILLVACGTPTSNRAANSAVPVAVVTMHRAALRSSAEFSGTISAVQSTTVGAMTGGRVEALDVRVGDNVVAGQTLARVDESQYVAQLSQANAAARSAVENAQAAQASAAAAENRSALAHVTAARMAMLYREGAISAEQHDQAESDLASARATAEQSKAEAAAARSAIAQAQAGVASAGVPVAQATITAPFDGVITQKFVQPGAVVAQGSPIVAIEGTHDMELDVAVPEDQAPELRAGAPVTVRVDALNGETIPSRIRAILPSNNPASRAVTVKLSLARRDGVIAGMFARVDLVKRATMAWVVPVGAVVNRDGQSGVFVVGRGVASFVPVTTGSVSGRSVAIEGITTPGSRVAISNLERLTDGTPVRIQP